MNSSSPHDEVDAALANDQRVAGTRCDVIAYEFAAIIERMFQARIRVVDAETSTQRFATMPPAQVQSNPIRPTDGRALEQVSWSWLGRGGLLLHALMLGAGWLLSSNVLADSTYLVNTTADLVDDNTDDGICHTSMNTCSLRAAIMQANHLIETGTVSISLPAGYFAITRPINGPNGEDNGDLNLTIPNTANQFIAILGAGSANTVIDGNQMDGVMTISAGRSAGIANLTVRNGLRQNGVVGGGAILNHGSMVILNCIVGDSSTNGAGGAIYSDSLLNVVDSRVSSSTAQGNGGGIFSSGTLNVTGSTITGNVAIFNFAQGGGLYLSGPARIRNSTISANLASNGGGLLTIDELTMVNSTISKNLSDTYGVGLFNFGHTFLYSTTIVGNYADFDGDNLGGGGGVFADTTGGHRLVAVNTLISSNTRRTASLYDDCQGVLEVYGFNRIGEPTGCTYSGNGAPAVGVVTRSTVGPLAENGGPTQTNALLAGSEAIDSTTPQGCIDNTGALLTTDQRGAARVAGARCDVGAYEYAAVIDLIFKSGFD